jgi:DNA polymerase elongation subunit (family B)
LISGKVDDKDLITTVSIAEEYKSQSVPQCVMAKRLRSNGADVNPGFRLEYLYVMMSDKCKLQGEKMYTPEEVRDNGYQIDYGFYLHHILHHTLTKLMEMLHLPHVPTKSLELAGF